MREEIREALIQGGFSFDDRPLDTEEASKGAADFAGLTLPQLSQITVHTEGRTESAKVFLSRHANVDSEGCPHLVLQRWSLECGPLSLVVSYVFDASTLQQKISRFVQLS